MEVIRRELQLEIEDFGAEPDRNDKIKRYYKLLTDYLLRIGIHGIVHTRNDWVPVTLF